MGGKAGVSAPIVTPRGAIGANTKEILKEVWRAYTPREDRYNEKKVEKKPTLSTLRVLGLAETLLNNPKMIQKVVPRGDCVKVPAKLETNLEQIKEADGLPIKSKDISNIGTIIGTAAQTVATVLEATGQHPPNKQVGDLVLFAALGMLNLDSEQLSDFIEKLQECDGSLEKDEKAKKAAQSALEKMSEEELEAFLAKKKKNAKKAKPAKAKAASESEESESEEESDED